ncbi:cyclic lactone autoinducer peptide [Defluviitalea raffinosedens]|jgi:cyclic lactone autoinducer peptide|uniref:Cyclic lactone autoinducer peptide n=1 Tax=Defluviitalea raffinosedens TaxID=1450156 RepID=A0A7C8HDQ2_9FIRM|nr:cyclic lactone autoinducer peptide [Defluviitalea raffinosedens]KAE9632035.1 cyclic lactone autoinducer peptide [Defluviitalea raffinosedens]MBM7686461.1 cyclic lactone autoinducer peptide [Defluviitalea raffinosedens]MBZ4667275.1 hypothetical protein [Defluviitaleaceae bacterium]
MRRRLLVILGTIATCMAAFTATAGACSIFHGETQVPEALQKDL